MAITKWSISASKKAPFRARTGLRTLGDQQKMPKAEVQRVLLNLEAQWLGDLGARLRRHGGTAAPVVQCNCNRLKKYHNGNREQISATACAAVHASERP